MFVKYWGHVCEVLGTCLDSLHPVTLTHETFGLQAASWQKFISKVRPVAFHDVFCDVQLIDIPLASAAKSILVVVMTVLFPR